MNTKQGKLFGIGIGPGDPELITIKAVKILEQVDVVAIPESRKMKGSIALDIAKEYLRDQVEILTLTFPMINDEEEKEKIRRENALIIKERIDAGNTVAFLTLGDPMLYSTYIYILNCLKDLTTAIETIPGITSFCAIGSSLNVPLATQNDTVAIIPLDKQTNIEQRLEDMDCCIFMKVSAANVRLADALKKYKDSIEVFIASRCGTDEEFVSSDIEDLYAKIPYLTTVVVKKKNPGRKNRE
ncbi:MAG: precorrin-2 C(20)-methyltransferase [bacterium]|nr:precorrin-2 C(20)-methyltransferase [bacterium]